MRSRLQTLEPVQTFLLSNLEFESVRVLTDATNGALIDSDVCVQ